MRLFGLYIERVKTRLERERMEHFRLELINNAEPTRELTREVQKLREAMVREVRKNREAAQCVSVLVPDGGRPVRCRLPNGHAMNHRSDGQEWETEEENAEAIR